MSVSVPALRLWLLVCMSLIVGCAAARMEPGSGSQLTVEGRTYDQVWYAALNVVAQHLRISLGTNKQRGTIRAEREGRIMAGSEVIGVFITPPNAASERYTVEVVSRKQGVGQFIGRNWEPIIIDGLKKELKL